MSEIQIPERERTVFLVIDMQKRFVRMIKREVRKKLIAAQVQTLENAVTEGFPIIIQHRYDYSGTIPEIKSFPHKLIPKYLTDGFDKTHLKRELYKLGAKNLFLMGVYAGQCVNHTARTARKEGFRIITAQDVIADNTLEDKQVLDKSEKWYKSKGIYLERAQDFFSKPNIY